MAMHGPIAVSYSAISFIRFFIFPKTFDKYEIYEIDIGSQGAPHDHHIIGVTYKRNGRFQVSTKIIKSELVDRLYGELDLSGYPVKVFDPNVKISSARKRLEDLIVKSPSGFDDFEAEEIYR